MKATKKPKSGPRVVGHARHHPHSINWILAGQVLDFVVYRDPALGSNGATAAADYLATCTGDLTWIAQLFGGITPPNLPFTIYITGGDPLGYGFHSDCSDTSITCNVVDASDPTLVNFLATAEIAEVFEAALNNGWNCSASNGEGLSGTVAMWLYRPLAPQECRDIFWLSSSAPTRPDWVSNNEATDLDLVSAGCAELFLAFLRYQLLFTPQQIVLTGGTTLADTFAALTGNPASSAFLQFSTLIESRFPGSEDWSWPDDNPFPLPNGRLHFERRKPSPPYPVLEVNDGWVDTDVGFSTRGGDFGPIVSNPSAVTVAGHTYLVAFSNVNTLLYLYRESPAAEWEQSQPIGDYFFYGNPSLVNDGTRLLCYARYQDGSLFEIVRDPVSGWTTTNVSTIATPVDGTIPVEPIAGDPVAIIANGLVQVFARTGNYKDTLARFTRPLGSSDWSFTDLSVTDGVTTITNDPGVLLVGTTVRLYVRDFAYAIQEIQINDAGVVTSSVITASPPTGVVMGVPAAVTDGSTISVFCRDDLRNLWMLSSPVDATSWTQSNVSEASGAQVDADPGVALAGGSIFVYARCGGLAEFRLDRGGSWVCTPVGGLPDVTGRPCPLVVPTAFGLDVQVYVTAI